MTLTHFVLCIYRELLGYGDVPPLETVDELMASVATTTANAPCTPTIDATTSPASTGDQSDVDMLSGDEVNPSGSPTCSNDDDVPIRPSKKRRIVSEDGTALCAASTMPTIAKKYTTTTNALKDAMGSRVYISKGMSAKIEVKRDGKNIHLTYNVANKDKSVTKIDYIIGPGVFISNTQGGTVNCGRRDAIIKNCELTFKVYALYLQIVHGSIAAGVSFNAYLKEHEESLPNFGDTSEDEGVPGADPESSRNPALLKLKYIIFNRANLPKDVNDQLHVSKLRVFSVLFLQAACLMVQSSRYTYSHEKTTPSGTFWENYDFVKFALYAKGPSGRSSIVGYKLGIDAGLTEQAASGAPDLPTIGYSWDEHLIGIFDDIVNGKSDNKDRRNLIQLLGQSFVSNKKLTEFDFGCKDNGNFNEAQAMQRTFAAEVITNEINSLMKMVPLMIENANTSANDLMLTEEDYAQLNEQREIVQRMKIQSEKDQLMKIIQEKDAEFKEAKAELQRELEANEKKLAKVQSELAEQRDKTANEAEKERCNKQIEAVKNTLENLRPRRANRRAPAKLNW